MARVELVKITKGSHHLHLPLEYDVASSVASAAAGISGLDVHCKIPEGQKSRFKEAESQWFAGLAGK